MAMTEIISPPTASIGTFASFTLARLPGETRNRIYQYAFEGSRMTLYRTDGSPRTPNDDDQESCRDGDCACQAIFRGSGHHRLLLTCRAVHDEARAIYWEQTTISAASSEDHIFSPNYFLSRIPDFAKSFVEHIEHCIRLGLNSRPPHDTLNGLRQFPNLKTVTLRDHLVELLIWCMEAPFVIKFEVYDVYRWAIKEWHAGLGSQLQDHETSTCPVFLQKVDFNMRPDRRDGNNVVAGDKTAFINLNKQVVWVGERNEATDAIGLTRALEADGDHGQKDDDGGVWFRRSPESKRNLVGNGENQ